MQHFFYLCSEKESDEVYVVLPRFYPNHGAYFQVDLLNAITSIWAVVMKVSRVVD